MHIHKCRIQYGFEAHRKLLCRVIAGDQVLPYFDQHMRQSAQGDPAQGKPAIPILWSDNDVTLWPGESLTLTARYTAQPDSQPVLEVSGWNVPLQVVPAAAGNAVESTQGKSH